MSIRYRSNNGTETIVSGLTPGGDLEYGAVATRTGATARTSVPANNYQLIDVTFDDPMPDSDYEVNLYPIFVTGSYGGSLTWDVIDNSVYPMTANGFTIVVYNSNSVASEVELTWRAFKLYTVQHAKENAEDIALIKSEIPAGASSSNQLTTKSYVDSSDAALGDRIADVEDLVPVDASIDNQLVTESQLDQALEHPVYINNTLLETEDATFSIRNIPSVEGASGYVRDKLIGGSIAWNQLVSAVVGNSGKIGITLTNNGDGSVTLNGTSTAVSTATTVPIVGYIDQPSKVTNHVYYMAGIPGGSNSTYCVYTYDGFSAYRADNLFRMATVDPNYTITVRVMASGVTFDNVKFYPQFIDLTRMLGSNIADYVFSLETSETGAGINWLRLNGFLLGNRYEYNLSSLVSCKPTAHNGYGFNIWNEKCVQGIINNSTGQIQSNTHYLISADYILVVPGQQYCMTVVSDEYASGHQTGVFIAYYDNDKTYIRRDVFALDTSSGSATKIFTAESYYIRIGFGDWGDSKILTPDSYGHDVCINISDSEKNGTYEPYTGVSYPLGPVDLRGVYKLDSETGKLYTYGDTYTSDGTVTRRLGVVNLGSFNWSYESNFKQFFSDVTLPNPKVGTVYDFYTDNQLCTKYTIGGGRGVDDSYPHVRGIYGNGRVYVVDLNYTDGASLKAALSGVYLVYELATPTTETAAPYAAVQSFEGQITEQYVDTRTISLPVHHEMDIMSATDDATLSIPSTPEESGNYVLTNQATGGVDHFSWQSADVTVGCKTSLDRVTWSKWGHLVQVAVSGHVGTGEAEVIYLPVVSAAYGLSFLAKSGTNTTVAGIVQVQGNALTIHAVSGYAAYGSLTFICK